jgi:hypothetical protein
MTMTEEIRAELAEWCPEGLTADGFDDAIIGIVERATRTPLVCYDYDRCVEVPMKRDGMSAEEAMEFLNFNTCGAWVGEHTPVFLHRLREEK